MGGLKVTVTDDYEFKGQGVGAWLIQRTWEDRLLDKNSYTDILNEVNLTARKNRSDEEKQSVNNGPFHWEEHERSTFIELIEKL